MCSKSGRVLAICGGIVAITGCAPRMQSSEPRILATAEQVRAVGPEDAREGLTVRIQGAVIYSVQPRKQLFVQDHTGGVEVMGWRGEEPLYSGRQILVEGVTSDGDGRPVVLARNVTPTGWVDLPKPADADTKALAADSHAKLSHFSHEN